MENGEHQSLEQIQAFLTGNKEIEFKAPNRKELYEWTQQALCGQSYSSLHRSGKGLMKRYIGKATGLSRAQVTRLIGQYTKSGIVRSRQGRAASDSTLDTIRATSRCWRQWMRRTTR